MKHYLKNDFELVDFTLLEKVNQEVLLKWRNDPAIRRWMKNTTKISKKNHFAFIENLRQSTYRQQWLVLRRKEKIGVVNLTYSNPIELGMYVAPDKQGKGLGSWMLGEFLTFIFTILRFPLVKLEVCANNQAAQHLYRKFGFLEKSRIAGLIQMELESPYEKG